MGITAGGGGNKGHGVMRGRVEQEEEEGGDFKFFFVNGVNSK